MKKLILIALLIPIMCSAQWNSKTLFFKKDKTVKYSYGHMIKYLTANINSIETICGKTIIDIPIERDFKKNLECIMIEGFLGQYTPTIGDEITILPTKCRVLRFDFENNKIQQKKVDTDTTLFKYPKNLKEKIKDKIKK